MNIRNVLKRLGANIRKRWWNLVTPAGLDLTGFSASEVGNTLVKYLRSEGLDATQLHVNVHTASGALFIHGIAVDARMRDHILALCRRIGHVSRVVDCMQLREDLTRGNLILANTTFHKGLLPALATGTP
jgi:hypothetical protein